MIQFVYPFTAQLTENARSVVKGKHWLMVIITDQHLEPSSSGQEPAGAGCALLCGLELCIKRRLFMMYKSLLLTSVN